MQLFRYPGGKAKLCDRIGGYIHAYYNTVKALPYREPFFGGGSVGLHLMDARTLPAARVNDFDPGIVAIWKSVLDRPDELCEAIKRFKPSVDAFFEIKDKLLKNEITKQIELAAAKIAVHQTSYSGLGSMAGGPIGGRDQQSAYKVDCRWNPDTLCRKIAKISRTMRRSNTVVTNDDFLDVINAEGEAFIYLDPPYYVQGEALYQHAFKHEHHVALAESLRRSTSPWLLSYDDAEQIREFYDFAEIESVSLNYTIALSKEDRKRTEKDKPKPKKTELLIYPRGLRDVFQSASAPVAEKQARRQPKRAPKSEENRGNNIFDDCE
jgi:DNA adenine methylase